MKIFTIVEHFNPSPAVIFDKSLISSVSKYKIPRREKNTDTHTMSYQVDDDMFPPC